MVIDAPAGTSEAFCSSILLERNELILMTSVKVRTSVAEFMSIVKLESVAGELSATTSVTSTCC